MVAVVVRPSGGGFAGKMMAMLINTKGPEPDENALAASALLLPRFSNYEIGDPATHATYLVNQFSQKFRPKSPGGTPFKVAPNALCILPR